MREVKAVYRDGQVSLVEPIDDPGPIEVTVLFPEEDDPWEKILNDPTPRPALLAWLKEAEEQIARGEAESLDLDKL